MSSSCTFRIQAFFDAVTGTVSYILHDRATRQAVVIDPVWDFDAASGRTATVQAQRVVDYLLGEKLQLRWVLETHAHADHLSAAQWLRAQVAAGSDCTLAPVAIGQKITQVQKVFGRLYGLEGEIAPLAADFDC